MPCGNVAFYVSEVGNSVWELVMFGAYGLIHTKARVVLRDESRALYPPFI